MKQKALILLLASALVASLIIQWQERPGAVNPAPYPELAQQLQSATRAKGLASASIGFCLLNSHGEAVVEHASQEAFIPASSLKTVTTATALEILGPHFRMETTLRSTAPIANGVLAGDLIIVGGADPMFSLGDVETCVEALKSLGLKHITGRIIGDGTVLRGSIYDDYWDWGDIGNGYGSPVSGLNLEHNRYTASFQAGPKEGDPASFLGAEPEVPGVQWKSEVTTAPPGSGDGVMIHGGERTPIIHMRGTVPLGSQAFTVEGAVPDPEQFAAHHFRKTLLAAGIEVEGEALAMSSLPPPQRTIAETAQILHTHHSPSLLDIIVSIHATSDNHEAECLFRLLGTRAGRAAVQVIRDHWKARGLTFEGLRMEDGCGLARADFIRPLDLARLQFFAAHGPYGEAYKRSLLSQEDGRLRWKGGAMSGIRTTTGYVVGTSGEEFCFALMINHHDDATAVSELRERVISAISRL